MILINLLSFNVGADKVHNTIRFRFWGNKTNFLYGKRESFERRFRLGETR